MKKTKAIVHLQGIMVLMLFGLTTFGQGWEVTYPITNPPGEGLRSIVQTIDGGYITTGSTALTSNNYGDDFLMKIDVHGDTSWTKAYDIADQDGGYEVQQTVDGGYIVLGWSRDLSGTYGNTWGNIHMFKTDAFGNQQWQKIYYSTVLEWGHSVDQTSDGGYIIAGRRGGAARIIKTDSIGDTLWTKTYDINPGLDDFLYDVHELSTGEYIFSGERVMAASQVATWLVKTNAQGDTLWTSSFGNANAVNNKNEVQPTSDGGFIIGGSQSASAFLVKTDGFGAEQWSNNYMTTSGTDRSYSVVETPDNGFAFTGVTYFSSNVANLFIRKVDNNGTELWDRKYGGNTTLLRWVGNSIRNTTDGGFIVGGTVTDNSTNFVNAYVIKTDSLGNIHSNYLHGNVYADFDGNCIRGSGEYGHDYWILAAFGSSDTIYATTDTGGYYALPLDIDTYNVSVLNVNPYWQASSCSSNSYVASYSVPYDTISRDFPQEPLINCSYMTVDVSAPFLRWCNTNTYTVNYCNAGTIDEPNALLELTFDSHLTPTFSSIPWNTPQTGNTYVFDLDTLNVGECGSFYLFVNLGCDSINAPVGQTHCVDAHIYPDTSCLPPSIAWDQSSILVEGNCITDDTVRFKIKNVGVGNMSAPLQYYVTEENIMMINSSFQLNAGDSLVINQLANGSTFRLVAEQSPNHPWGETPLAVTIEGCGTNQFNMITTGLFTTMPTYDYAPYLSTDCQASIASYDPNDKYGFPEGYGIPHYIEAEDHLNYRIRFQNTGTDTAFTVVLRDTLTHDLDIGTIQTGVSSHPYTFNIYGNRVLEWTFHNIMLPDSSVNEPGSHGFVKFSVEQTPGNPVGTVIENFADIYFDFNAPVRTDTTFHTIGEDFIILNVENVYHENVEIIAYPNPFNDYTIIKVDGKTYDELTLEVFDMTGKLVHTEAVNQRNQILLPKGHLQHGTYLFSLTSGGQKVGTGKLIVQ